MIVEQAINYICDNLNCIVVCWTEMHADAISLGQTDATDVDDVSVGCHPDKQGKFSL
jgi:hypothetical protein